MDLSFLNASNGTGEAVQATVTTGRNKGSTTLIVDVLTNWPAKFVAVYARKLVNNTLDPSTLVVFYGHTNNGQIIIDGFAPGYSDNGNSLGDVVVIKPTTAGTDTLANLLQVAHNANGTLKSGSITSDMIADGAIATNDIANSAITTAKIADGSITPAKMVGVDLFGAGGSYGGTPPGAGTGQFYMQAGSTVTTLNAAGVNTIVFPTAFPNGLLTVVITQGDTSVDTAFRIQGNATSASQFSVNMPSAANSNVRINWIAIGF